MKLVINRAVLSESQLVGQRICETFSLPYRDYSIDEQMSAMQAATVNLANVRFEVVGDELHYTVDDKVVVAILRIYSKFAGYIKTLVDIAKPLFKTLQSDMEDVSTLMLEVKDGHQAINLTRGVAGQ